MVLKRLVGYVGMGVLLGLMAACAPSSYIVKAPMPSDLKYISTAGVNKTELGLIDKREGVERVFSSGVLPANLLLNTNTPIDPPSFLATQLEKELMARGLPVKVVAGDKGVLSKLDVRTFRILNHRATGFSPFVTFTFLSADLDTPSGKKRLAVFVKRGKIPVWSFEEVVEPTFNQPLSIAVQELASKISNQVYGVQASDTVVADLAKKLATKRGPDSYLDVYALGFTNNPKAIDVIVPLLKENDEYIRIAAISSLGILRATSQFAMLKSIYADRTMLWQDRAMAIKAIGDLDTPESKQFLIEERKRWEGQGSDKESNWTAQVIGLYL